MDGKGMLKKIHDLLNICFILLLHSSKYNKWKAKVNKKKDRQKKANVIVKTDLPF